MSLHHYCTICGSDQHDMLMCDLDAQILTHALDFVDGYIVGRKVGKLAGGAQERAALALLREMVELRQEKERGDERPNNPGPGNYVTRMHEMWKRAYELVRR